MSDRSIFIVGSLNADLVQAVPRPPRPGETLRGGDLRTFAGGKGGNQAVAAARMGGRVRMIGRVGEDDLGSFLLDSLRSAGVEAEGVRRSSGSTGTAVIQILPDGDNMIVIAPGANASLITDEVEAELRALEAGDLLLCQLEIPVESVGRALRLAKQAQATTILDPAPADLGCLDFLDAVDVLTPNETEALLLLGRADDSLQTDEEVMRAAQDLQAIGAGTVILKLGARGCCLSEAETCTLFPAHAVGAVDTTGAGDTFNGALAAALAGGKTRPDAIRIAQAAAAISVTRPGAQDSVPTQDEVAELLRK